MRALSVMRTRPPSGPPAVTTFLLCQSHLIKRGLHSGIDRGLRHHTSHTLFSNISAVYRCSHKSFTLVQVGDAECMIGKE